MCILKMECIRKEFPGVVANDNVNLEVGKGEIHALLGENGAGKTTLMNILYGIYTRGAGKIFWKGKEVDFHSPKDAIEQGIGMVHQHFMLVSTLSVAQNITLGLKLPGYPLFDKKKINHEIAELSKKYGLQVYPDKMISDLSVGTRQRVEILKSLYRNAELIILDEPTAVLTPQETSKFFDVLLRLKAEGHSVIIITHRIPEVLQITDKVTILKDAKNVITVRTKDTNELELSQYMIGRSLKAFEQKSKVIPTLDKGLILDKVCYAGKSGDALKDISFKINCGEILGVAGVDGNGQQELAEIIAGIIKPKSGTILLDKEMLNRLDVKHRKRTGVAYIAADRHHDGLVLDMDVSENMILKDYYERPVSRKGIMNFDFIRKDADKKMKKYQIKAPHNGTKVRLLSGGNQQKVILSRELANQPRAVVACQPTRGLDIGASEFVREQLLASRNNGSSILLISADLEEIVSISDRIAVMFEGKIVGIVQNDENLDLKEIGLMMAGRNSWGIN